jgi:hypothetical protein
MESANWIRHNGIRVCEVELHNEHSEAFSESATGYKHYVKQRSGITAFFGFKLLMPSLLE